MLSSAQMPPKVAAEQRVGIAQALLGNPEIVILDEPTVGLDPKQSIEIRTLIRDLAKEHTVILSSHILAEVQAVCDRILIIHHGKMVAAGRSLLRGMTELEPLPDNVTVTPFLETSSGVAVTEDGTQTQGTYLLGAVCQKTGETLSFEKDEEGVWHDVSGADFPLDQSYLTALETTLSQLSAMKVIPDPEEDASYGLDAPDMTLTATAADGESLEITVGSEVDGNYYARPAGDSQVYTIAASLMNQTEHGLMEMIDLDTIPTVTESSVESVEIVSGGVTTLFTRETVTGTDEEGDETTSYACWKPSGDTVPAFLWTISPGVREKSGQTGAKDGGTEG